jgi:hypothetical protein
VLEVNEPPQVDAEKLAALLDGRLSERERATVLAQLAGSPELRETYADAIAALGTAETAGSPVVPIESRVRRRRWGPVAAWVGLAAVLAGVVLLPAVRGRLRSSGPGTPGDFVELLREPGAALPTGWDTPAWSSTRGPSDPLTPEARAARIGARIVDLEVAIAARDSAAGRIAQELVLLLEGAPAGAPVAAMFREVAGKVDAPSPELTRKLDDASAAATVLAGAEQVRLGAWAEAARIAAVTRDTAFFGTDDAFRPLERARRLPVLTPPARLVVDAIIRAKPSSDSDWRTLETHTADLLRALGS